jgi:hypothetical protein
MPLSKSRITQLLEQKEFLLSKGQDVSHIDAELLQVYGKKFGELSEGGEVVVGKGGAYIKDLL